MTYRSGKSGTALHQDPPPFSKKPDNGLRSIPPSAKEPVAEAVRVLVAAVPHAFRNGANVAPTSRRLRIQEDRDSAPGDEEELLDGVIADMFVAAACDVRYRRQLPSALPRRLDQARDFLASM